MFVTFYTSKLTHNEIKMTFTAQSDSDQEVKYRVVFGNKGRIVELLDNLSTEEREDLLDYYKCDLQSLTAEIFWDGIIMTIEYIDGASGDLPIHPEHGQTIYYSDI